MAIASDNKFVVKHGLHTQNVDFVSPDTTKKIEVSMLDGDRLSFSGNSGQLFSITDDMTGTIFAVNDVSGVPSIEVDADGTIRIAETFGNVLIGTAVDDGTTKLQIAGDVSISGTLTANGLTAGGDISFADNERLYFGDGNDASIYFDGNNLNIIESSGTGNFYLRGSDIVFAKSDLSETYAQMYANGRVDLYFDNAVKFSTTTTGIDVTGDTNTDTLTTSGNATIGANLTVTGDLTVNGTTTTVNTTNLNVTDAVITLASGQATPSNDIGLVFQRYSSPTVSNYNPVLIWEESTDRFIFGTTTETGADNDIQLADQWMTVKSAGVGIGTTNPTVPLDILATNSTGIVVRDNDSWATIVVDGGGGTENQLELTNFGLNTSGSIIRTTGGGMLRFAAGNTEAIRILGNNQFVGINTDNPLDRLHVFGSVRATSPAANDWAFIGQNSGGTASSGLWYTNDSSIFIGRNSSDDVKVYMNSNGDSYLTGGDVGIGTTNPITALDVHDVGANGINIGVDSSNSTLSGRLFFTNGTAGKSATILNISNNLGFYTQATPDNSSGTQRMIIREDGRVGIGTGNPNYNLSVASSLNVFSAGDTAAPQIEGHLLLAEGQDGNADVTHWYLENSSLTFGMRWYYDGNNVNGTNTLRLYRHNNSAVGNEVIRFFRDSDNVAFTGNVGIGTTAPTHDLDVRGDAQFIGEIKGGGSQLGTTTTRGSRLINTFLGSSPEDVHVYHPYLHNDLADFRYRGGTVTVAGATLTGVENAFRPNASHAYCGTSSISGNTWTITLTDLPASLSYTTYIGITFGSQTFSPDSVKIEREVSGVWATVYDSNVKTPYHIATASVSGTPISSIRYTLGGNSATTSIRINSMFAYDYNSDGMDQYFLPRHGGNLYGNVAVDNTLGTDTELTISSKQNAYLTLNSDTDNNANGQNIIYFREGGDNRWGIQRTPGNSLQFNRFNASTGAYIDSPISIDSGAGNVSIANNLDVLDGRLRQQFSDTANLWTDIGTGVNAYEPTDSELVIENDGINTTNSMASIFFRAGSTTADLQINSARIAAVRESGFNTSLAFATRSQSLGHTEKLRITSGGAVGIGTSSPSELLHVNGSATDVKIAIQNEQYTGNNRLEFKSLDNNSNVVTSYIKSGWYNTPGMLFHAPRDGSGYGFAWESAAGDELMRLVTSDGHLGIGVTNPDEILHVNTTDKYTLHLQRNSYSDNDLNLIRFSNSGTSGVYSSYIGSLRSAGAAGAGELVFGTAPNIQVGTDSIVERMRITKDGDVGIGTNNPQYKLDVAGTINADTIKSDTTEGIYIDTGNAVYWYKLGTITSIGNRVLVEAHGQDTYGGEQSTVTEASFQNGNQVDKFGAWQYARGNSTNSVTFYYVGIAGTSTMNIYVQLGAFFRGQLYIKHGENFTVNSTITTPVSSPAGAVAATDRLDIKSTTYFGSFVGINTSNPTANLQVNGNAVISDGTNGLNLGGLEGNIEITRSAGNPYIDFKSSLAEDYDVRIQQESNGLKIVTGGNGAALNALIVDSSQRVGIGTAPSAALDVYDFTNTANSDGTTLMRLYNYVGTDLSQQKTFVDFTLTDDNTNETPQVRIGAEVGRNGSANDQFAEGSGAFVVYTNNANNTAGSASNLTEKLRVDAYGNVGIGTNAPSRLQYQLLDPKLHVVQSSTNGAFNLVARFESGTDSNDSGAAILINHSNDRGLLIEAGRGGAGTTADDDAISHLGLLNSAGALTRVVTLRQNRDNAQNVYGVGIGTTAPQTKLHVNGTQLITPVLYSANQDSAYLIAGATTYTGETTNWGTQGFQHRIKVNSGGTPRITIDDTSGESFTLVNGGNIGIGTTNPTNKLHLYKSVLATEQSDILKLETYRGDFTGIGGSSILFQNQDSNNGVNTARIKVLTSNSIGDFVDSNEASTNMVFSTSSNGTEANRMVIASNGNVGIGTVSPFSKLQVNGHIFSGGNGMYTDSRVGISNHGNLTGMMLASTYDNADYPEYGLVFVQGPSTSNYNVWSLSPDGPSKGDGLNFIYGSGATNIHTVTPKVTFDGNGNVGIGSAVPQSKLDINGGSLYVNTNSASQISAEFTSGIAGDGRIRLAHNQGNVGIVMDDFGDGTGGDQGWGLVANDRNAGSFTINWYANTNYDTNITAGIEMFTILGDGAKGNVGIGSTVPQSKLDVNGNITVKSDITYTSPDGTNQIITRMLDTDTLSFSGDSGQLFSITDSVTGSIFSVNDVSGIPSIEVIDDGTVILAETFGNVGIGTTNPAAKLHVVGAIYATGDVTAYYSDIRLKNVESNIEHAIDKVRSINGFYYTGNDTAHELGFTKEEREVGVSAQDVESVLPEAVSSIPGNEEYKTVKYERMVPLLIEAIKEQQTMIDELREEIDRLNNG